MYCLVGKEKAICLYNENGKLETWRDYCEAVVKLTDSLFLIDKVFRFDIVFNNEKEEVNNEDSDSDLDSEDETK